MPMDYWHGDEFIQEVTAELEDRMDVAGNLVAQQQRELVSQDYPPASRPNEPPRRRTGTLQGSIWSDKAGPLERHVGGHAPYTLALDQGLGKLKGRRRPFLMRGLMESFESIREVMFQRLEVKSYYGGVGAQGLYTGEAQSANLEHMRATTGFFDPFLPSSQGGPFLGSGPVE